MKIQLDTTNKTIKLEEDVKLDTLVKTLNKLLPNKEWKNFILQTNTTISYFTNPIIYREIVKEKEPYYPPSYPWYNADDPTKLYRLNSGIYNIEV